ncbi:DUF3108 domain-containing protein [Bacteroides sp. 224]|nr:DUF3108 domain-containing protein [Bacteroides sp. 224]NDV67098.1 DUF3108 domain-containing protein [Bacteroides sp. 224]
MNNLKQKLKLICLLCLLGGFASSAYAQCEAKNEAFLPGEEVSYDLFFNWRFVWTKAGLATLSFDETIYKGKPAYKIDLIAAGNKTADFFFKLRDTLTSVVSHKLEPIYFRKGAIEGKRYWVDEAFFTHKDGVSYVTQKRLDHRGNTHYFEHNDSRCIHDMLSILARARSFDPTTFKVGHRISFPMTTGKRVEEQYLVYRGKEEFRAEDKNIYKCLLFSFVERKDGKDVEVITFYITDDKNHLPVRLDLFLNFGSAKAFLKEVKGNRYPLTSIKK